MEPDTASAIVRYGEPDSLDDFKSDVRTWLELDNSIRRLQAAIKDRRAAKKQLSERILRFMADHNIEDLDTKDGKLRYRIAFVRTPLSQAVIKERISSYFGVNNDNAATAMNGVVFGNRARVEKTSLCRLRGGAS
jgi:hypothetical protein